MYQVFAVESGFVVKGLDGSQFWYCDATDAIEQAIALNKIVLG
jgi:hypothetical protein